MSGDRERLRYLDPRRRASVIAWERHNHRRVDSALLTLRVAERMAGTIGVLSVYGDEWFGNARTAQRRRAELRKVGIEFVSDLAPGVRVEVGRVLQVACAAWDAPAASTRNVSPR